MFFLDILPNLLKGAVLGIGHWIHSTKKITLSFFPECKLSFIVMRKRRDKGNPFLEVATTFCRMRFLSENSSNT